jgi:hypothetical protein
MNVSALVAGWPFAVLLMLYARCADQVPLSGIVIGKDDQSKVLILERDGATYPMQIGVATTICGMDGYPISIDDVRIGHHVEVVQ